MQLLLQRQVQVHLKCGVKGDITLQLHAHTVCYGTPLLGIPESFPCQICVLQPFTHSTTSKSFLKFKNKVAFVCLFVLPFAILLPGGKFKTHKRRRLINYRRCWAAKLLKSWHSRMYMVKIRKWIHKRSNALRTMKT